MTVFSADPKNVAKRAKRASEKGKKATAKKTARARKTQLQKIRRMEERTERLANNNDSDGGGNETPFTFNYFTPQYKKKTRFGSSTRTRSSVAIASSMTPSDKAKSLRNDAHSGILELSEQVAEGIAILGEFGKLIKENAAEGAAEQMELAESEK